MIRVVMMNMEGRNPFVRLLVGGLGPGYSVSGFKARRRLRDADIFHVHWPENLFRPSKPTGLLWTALVWWRFFAAIDLVRRHGALVWTVHNLERHESLSPGWRSLQKWLLPRFYARVDVAVAMSAAQLPQLRSTFPDIRADRWRVVAHPHYRGVYRGVRPPAEIRELFEVPEAARLAVLFGNLRPYKRVPDVVRAFRQAAVAGEVLVVAGPIRDRALRREIEAAAAGSDAVRLRFGPLSDDDLASLLRAADIALYNFSRVLNSGSILAALSLDCPVLAPRNPGFEELARVVGDPGWIDLFDGPLTPQRLRASLDRLDRHRPAGSPDLDAHSVAAVGEAYRRIYAEAIELRQRERA